MERQDYVLGIDVGTQALTVVAVSLFGEVLAKGEYAIPMISGPNGEREQHPEDWRKALSFAMISLRKDIELGDCLGVCPSGQMHAEVLRLQDGWFYDTARLWCDSRNSEEADRLTSVFGINVPQRLTCSRWLWTIRYRPDLAHNVVGITTTAGTIASFLDAKAWSLGLGDARGMFPIDPDTQDYVEFLADKFDWVASSIDASIPPITRLLPKPVPVGTIVGHVDPQGAQLIGIPIGTPIFAPEGDQPTTLAGCYVSDVDTFAASGGTSICMNLITNHAFEGVHPGVEQFMTADGSPFLMCHVENGSSFMNLIVKMYGALLPDTANPFECLMPLAEKAHVDCGGIMILPLAEAEHGLEFPTKATSGIFNLNGENNTPGNTIRAAMTGAFFSILVSVEAMRKQDIGANRIVASGGIVQSNWIGQLMADVFELPVEILGEAEEGSAYGAALMAIYGYRLLTEPELTWVDFINSERPIPSKTFAPIEENVATLWLMFVTYLNLVKNVEPALIKIDWKNQ